MKIINPKLSIGIGLACFAVMCLDFWKQDGSKISDLSVVGKLAMVVFCVILLYYVVVLIGGMVVNLFRKR